jgi:hypothetical protein
MLPRIRRINKSFDSSSVGEKTSLVHKGKFGFLYSPYSLNCTGNCSTIPGSSSTSPYINFFSTFTSGSTVEINGVTFTANGGAGPTDLCTETTCTSPSDTATMLALKINSSTDPLLKGITARSSLGDVFLYGMEGYDHLNFDGSNGTNSTTVLANGMGKIFIQGSYWFLPVINASLSGALQNNISIISGLVDVKLQDAAISLSDTDVLDNIGKVAAFDMDVSSSGELVIASISGDLTNAGRARLSRFELSGRDYQIPFSGTPLRDVLGTDLFESIKVAAATLNNNNIYLLAKERALNGGEYRVGRYSGNLSSVNIEDFLMNRLDTSDNTFSVISDTLMTRPSIVSVPNSADARIFFNSVGTPVSANSTRVARWRNDNLFSCGLCAPIARVETSSNVAVSSVFLDNTGTSTGLGIGAVGNTANENKKEFVFVMTNFWNGFNYEPQIGMINTRPELIQATTVDNINNLWRPPFAK